MKNLFRLAVAFVLAWPGHALAQTGDAQQIADPDFKPAVVKPAYQRAHSVVVLDEAHNNFHTVSGRSRPPF